MIFWCYLVCARPEGHARGHDEAKVRSRHWRSSGKDLRRYQVFSASPVAARGSAQAGPASARSLRSWGQIVSSGTPIGAPRMRPSHCAEALWRPGTAARRQPFRSAAVAATVELSPPRRLEAHPWTVGRTASERGAGRCAESARWCSRWPGSARGCCPPPRCCPRRCCRWSTGRSSSTRWRRRRPPGPRSSSSSPAAARRSWRTISTAPSSCSTRWRARPRPRSWRRSSARCRGPARWSTPASRRPRAWATRSGARATSSATSRSR